MNRQLQENIDRLKASNEELERFAYVASHDLQEPLRKIMLFSDQLSVKHKNALNEEGQDFIGRIMRASERMRVLIKNILSFSRSAANSESFEETDLNELVSGILFDLEVSIEQKRAIVNVGPLPVLKTVPGQFRQLFQNLIINALKFSKEDCPPEIHIYSERIRSTKSNGMKKDALSEDHYDIYVKDNGIGFEQKYANEVFTLFKRLNSYDKFEGTGIGFHL